MVRQRRGLPRIIPGQYGEHHGEETEAEKTGISAVWAGDFRVILAKVARIRETGDSRQQHETL